MDDRDKWQLKYDITTFVSFASNYDEVVLEYQQYEYIFKWLLS